MDGTQSSELRGRLIDVIQKHKGSGNWREIAGMLAEAEQQQSWHEEFMSKTEWLKGCAKDAECSEGLLFKYASAWRFLKKHKLPEGMYDWPYQSINELEQICKLDDDQGIGDVLIRIFQGARVKPQEISKAFSFDEECADWVRQLAKNPTGRLSRPKFSEIKRRIKNAHAFKPQVKRALDGHLSALGVKADNAVVKHGAGLSEIISYDAIIERSDLKIIDGDEYLAKQIIGVVILDKLTAGSQICMISELALKADLVRHLWVVVPKQTVSQANSQLIDSLLALGFGNVGLATLDGKKIKVKRLPDEAQTGKRVREGLSLYSN